MLVFRNNVHWHEILESVVTIGTFDGLHLGHQAILRAVKAISVSDGLYPLVVTFHPHPRTIINHGTQVPLIESLGSRLRQFARLGVDMVLIQPFTREFASQTPVEFADRVLCREFKARKVVMGWDHAFGRQRSGNREVMAALGQQLGFAIHDVPPVRVNGELVSSSAIRAKLAAGDVTGAAAMLGRPYELWRLARPRVGSMSRAGALVMDMESPVTDRVALGSGVYAGFATHAHCRYPIAIAVHPSAAPFPRSQRIELHFLAPSPLLTVCSLRVEFHRRVSAATDGIPSRELLSLAAQQLGEA